MRNRFLIFLLLGFCALTDVVFTGCESAVQSTQNNKTSFAIVVDPVTKQKVESSILAYKEMLESEGLKVYVLSDNWASADTIRETLKSYYHSKPQLEGAVFIGDVPIPFVMDAQHLTTAYKRNPGRYPLHIAAIPSDRFYDDFDLEFDFIEKDSVRPLNYYYSLAVNSPQYVRSDIYTGRIKPSIFPGEDKYNLIEAYLNKVVSLRNNTELDFLMTFTGHGYNSNALTAWAGEKLALREQFPELYTTRGRIEFLEYRMDEFMKPFLLSRLQDPDLDIAVLHEHGAPEIQLINGTPDVSSVPASIENIKKYLRSKLRVAKDQGRSLSKTKQDYMARYEVPEAWFDGTFDKEIMDQDSVYSYNMDIYTEDVHEISPEAKFIMFDACFNGSYHKDRYLAGEYVFGKGSTMVAFANSVNSLQDKWPNEMLGLLKWGVRVGNWAKQINTMETHLIGDPTYYFKTNSTFDYNKVIATPGDNRSVWEELLTAEDPDLQCLAISQLSASLDSDFSNRLRELYFSSPSFVVRMEILKQLYHYNDQNFKQVLGAAVSDPYELIRRTAAGYIGDCGDDELIEPLLKIIFDDNYSKRVRSNAYGSLDFMDPDALTQALPAIAQKYSYVMNSSVLRDQLLKRVAQNKKKVTDYFEYAAADTSVMKYRMQEIRTLRNYYYHFVADDYARLLTRDDLDNDLRKALVEAFGWFTHSVQYENIVKAVGEVAVNENLPEDIRQEAKRTLNRLAVFNPSARLMVTPKL